MANQNFGTYTEVDPNNKITKTASRVSWVDIRRNEDAYVYKDKGENYFDNSFVHHLTIRSISASGPGGTAANIDSFWVLANLVDDYTGISNANGDGYFLFFRDYRIGAPKHIIFLVELDGGAATFSGEFQLTVDTDYYLKIVRDESAGTFGTLYCYIYSDAVRETLVGLLTRTLHSSKKDFRYVYAVQTINTGDSSRSHTGYTENLDLDVLGDPTVTTQAVTSVLQFTAIGNGNITSIGAGAVSQHGVVFSETNPVPLLSNSRYTNEGAVGVGAFTSEITTLRWKTKYYLRAYAINVFGTSYGSVVTFYTDPNATVSLGFGQSIFTESPDWDDVSDDVIGFDIKRGRNHDLDRIEAGTAVLTLKNLEGNYWRYNTGGDYYPNVKPLALVRISAVWSGVTYRRFYGLVESFQHSWIDQRGAKVPIVTVQCVDLFKSLARLKLHSLPGTVGSYTNAAALKSNAASGQKDVIIKSLGDSATEGCDIKFLHVGQSITIKDNSASEVNTIASIDEGTYTLTMTNNLASSYTTGADGHVKKFPAVLSGTRVADVLYELGWPASLTDLDAGQVTVIEYVPAEGGEVALKHLQDVAESDGGIIFVGGLGKVVFQDRDARLSTSEDALTCLAGTLISLVDIQAIFSDYGNDQKYVAAEP